MARLLITVEDTFYIKKGRGVVPAPGIIPFADERIFAGAPILLRRPDGTTQRWKIGGIEMPNPPPPRGDIFILLSGLTKEDVSIGTEIWSDHDG